MPAGPTRSAQHGLRLPRAAAAAAGRAAWRGQAEQERGQGHTTALALACTRARVPSAAWREQAEQERGQGHTTALSLACTRARVPSAPQPPSSARGAHGPRISPLQQARRQGMCRVRSQAHATGRSGDKSGRRAQRAARRPARHKAKSAHRLVYCVVREAAPTLNIQRR